MNLKNFFFKSTCLVAIIFMMAAAPNTIFAQNSIQEIGGTWYAFIDGKPSQGRLDVNTFPHTRNPNIASGISLSSLFLNQPTLRWVDNQGKYYRVYNDSREIQMLDLPGGVTKIIDEVELIYDRATRKNLLKRTTTQYFRSYTDRETRQVITPEPKVIISTWSRDGSGHKSTHKAPGRI